MRRRRRHGCVSERHDLNFPEDCAGEAPLRSIQSPRLVNLPLRSHRSCSSQRTNPVLVSARANGISVFPPKYFSPLVRLSGWSGDEFLIGTGFADFISNARLILAQRADTDHVGRRGIKTPKRKRRNLLEQAMEDRMKSLVKIAAAIAIVSLGSLVSAQAGGGATSAPSKYSNETGSANFDQARRHQTAQTADFRITEFSSSSARSSVPKR